MNAVLLFECHWVVLLDWGFVGYFGDEFFAAVKSTVLHAFMLDYDILIKLKRKVNPTNYHYLKLTFLNEFQSHKNKLIHQKILYLI